MTPATVARVYDREMLEAFYRPKFAAHLYEVGDLDETFWPNTAYHALFDAAGTPQQVALMYEASQDLSILLATTEPELRGAMRDLLVALAPALPDAVYAHVNANVAETLLAAGGYQASPYGTHWKMSLSEDVGRVEAAGMSDVVRLSPEDASAVTDLYAAAYPDGWFDARLLATGFYFGVWDDSEDRLLSVAGVHVASERYGVATIGNVATHPEARGRGFARATCATLCRDLRAHGIVQIGLNVRTDNTAALACYRALGFAPVDEYEEMMLTRDV